MSSQKLLARFSLNAADGADLSEVRIRLLEQIDAHGSITQAARAVPISYKAAWDAIDTLNHLAPHPLVLRSAGGSQGGGSQLTPYGRRLVALYRALQAESQATLDRVQEQAGLAEDDTPSMLRLMQRVRVSFSARNQFFGVVTELGGHGLASHVRLRIDETTSLLATITQASAERMGLSIGVEVLALIKAPGVTLAAPGAEPADARMNVLTGQVITLEPGDTEDEATLCLPGGRHLTALVPRNPDGCSPFPPGTPACAMFHASAVMLARYT